MGATAQPTGRVDWPWTITATPVNPRTGCLPLSTCGSASTDTETLLLATPAAQPAVSVAAQVRGGDQ